MHEGRAGIIVETEAYAEFGDEACHTFSRKSAQEFMTKHDAGAVYVYLNYGMYWLLNFMTVAPNGDQGFVLVRALEPTEGLDEMHLARTKKKPLRERDLCSGPGKLTIALGIGSEFHESYLGEASPLSLKVGDPQGEIVSGPRIGISKAVDFPWRFYLHGNPHVSR